MKVVANLSRGYLIIFQFKRFKIFSIFRIKTILGTLD